MDHRMPLDSQTVLAFEGMTCYIEKVIGCGSNAVVYKGWYRDQLNLDQRHHVLIKELFPYHPQGKIRRDKAGQRIVVEPEARDVWQMHRDGFLAGNEIHLKLLAEYPDELGANVNSFSYNGTLYSVLGYHNGRSLQEELNQPGQTLRQQARRMLGLLDALEAFHSSGYLHLDVSPDNIILIGQEGRERIFLIDYNSVRPVDASGGDALSYKAGYCAPEVETNARYHIGFASDLYSAAAVFFRCLMGRTLSLEEKLRPKAPDGADSPYLRNAPQTVRDLVGRILKKGLHILPGKRYQSTRQMRQVFLELIDRIDCVGVTHWALWENGRRSVEELIRLNPAFRYLRETERLYPIRLDWQGGVCFRGYLEHILSEKGRSGLIAGEGGMGKTTLLLQAALLQGKKYLPASPAMFYISLSGWNGTDRYYIRNQILLRLRFKQGENFHDSAIHALHQLFQQRLTAKNGSVPAALLLLDGLNEVHGGIGPLVQEINELAAMPGVRILAASRSGLPELHLEQTRLLPLEDADVTAALGESGLLVPREDSVRVSLRTPLILSIYIQASAAGKQPDIGSEAELMRAYFAALYEKEVRQLPEQARERWQLEAALYFVLPCVAVEMERSGGALTGGQLLQAVRRCWKLVRAPVFRRIFPNWIGRSRDILADAKTAEEWYGLMIHQFLWQRLGILTKEPDGGYRIYHQTVLEYLARTGKGLRRRIRKGQHTLRTAAGIFLAAVTLPACLLTLPRGYDPKQTETVIDHLAVCYSAFGRGALGMRTLLKKTEHPANFLDTYDWYAEHVGDAAGLAENEQRYLAQIAQLCESGDRVPWSKLPMDEEAAMALMTESSQRLQAYVEYLPLLKSWTQSPRTQEEYPGFPQAFRELLEADAQILSKLYYQSCAPHLAGGDLTLRDSVESLIATIPGSGKEPEEALFKLKDHRKQKENALIELAAGVQLLCQEDQK